MELLEKLQRRLSAGKAGKLVFYCGPGCGIARHGTLRVYADGCCMLDFGASSFEQAIPHLVGPHLLRVLEFDDPSMISAANESAGVPGARLVQLLDAASTAESSYAEVTVVQHLARSLPAKASPVPIQADWLRELHGVLSEFYGATAEVRLAEWQQRYPEDQTAALLDTAERWLAEMIGSSAAQRRLAGLRRRIP